MYGLKKLMLINRKLHLVRKIGRLTIRYEKHWYRNSSLYRRQIESMEDEIEAIDEILEYLQKEKPANAMKVSNNNLNVGAKNESGLHVDFPVIKN